MIKLKITNQAIIQSTRRNTICDISINLKAHYLPDNSSASLLHASVIKMSRNAFDSFVMQKLNHLKACNISGNVATVLFCSD